MKNQTPQLSIICITYNHENYLAQALDSFLMQKTDFPIEILVHDDASTDKTAEILRDYAARYPEIIKPLYEKTNQFSKGNTSFLNKMYEQAKGKYIACCEGDDFWTDPQKLQLQVDFLNAHSDYSICFHPVRVFLDDQTRPDEIYPDPSADISFTVAGLLKQNFIQSNSFVYRKQSYTNLVSNIMPFDWYTSLYHAQFGKIGFIDRVMSAYRRHAGGIWWESTENRDKFWMKHGFSQIQFYLEVMKLYGSSKKYAPIIENNIFETLTALIDVDIRLHSTLLAQIQDVFPDVVASFIMRQHTQFIQNQQAINRLQAQHESDNQQMKTLNTELQAIKDSKAYQLARQAGKVRHALRGSKRGNPSS